MDTKEQNFLMSMDFLCLSLFKAPAKSAKRTSVYNRDFSFQVSFFNRCFFPLEMTRSKFG